MKKYVITLIMLMCLTGFSLADVINPVSVWNALEQMSLEERSNSEIELVLENGAAYQAEQMAHQIETLWNDGHFDEALALCPYLEELTDVNEMAIGNSWRTPVYTENISLWENDVRIGGRDSILVTTLDVNHEISNVFAVFLMEGDGIASRWVVYLGEQIVESSDTLEGFVGDIVWSETYNWVAGYTINTMNAVVMGNRCYVVYSRGTAQNQINLRAFKDSTGEQIDFSDGSRYINVFAADSTVSITEMALTSNQDSDNNKLYLLAITDEGNLLYSSADAPCTIWPAPSTVASGAEKGLDFTFNAGAANLYLWTSYINTGDNLQVYAYNGTIWSNYRNYSIGSEAVYTSIGAYKDTVFCFFDYTGSRKYVRYWASYDGGSNWESGAVDDTTTTTSESPDVTKHDTSGVGVVYKFNSNTPEIRYAWYSNSTGLWSSPVVVSGFEAHCIKPSVEYFWDGAYGVVSLRMDTVRVYTDTIYIDVETYIWFCRDSVWSEQDSEWVCTDSLMVPPGDSVSIEVNPEIVADSLHRAVYYNWLEPPEPPLSINDNLDNLPLKFELIQNYPNPFNAKTIISYTISKETEVTVDIYDILGRKVTTLVDEEQTAGNHQIIWDAGDNSSGVYFYRIHAGDKTDTKRMVLLK